MRKLPASAFRDVEYNLPTAVTVGGKPGNIEKVLDRIAVTRENIKPTHFRVVLVRMGDGQLIHCSRDQLEFA